jgi:hypothetical protein
MKISEIDERKISEKVYPGLVLLKKGDLIPPSDYKKLYDYVHRPKKSRPSSKKSKKSKNKKSKKSSSSDDLHRKTRIQYSENQRREPVVIDLLESD